MNVLDNLIGSSEQSLVKDRDEIELLIADQKRKRKEEAYIDVMREDIDNAFSHVGKEFPGEENAVKRNEHYLMLIGTALEIIADDASLIKGEEATAVGMGIKLWREMSGWLHERADKIERKEIKRKKAV